MAVVVVAVGGASTSTAREATKPLAVQLILDELGGLNPRLESVIERLQSGRKPWEEEPELESLSMLLDDIVKVLIPLVYGIPFEEWFSCFYKVDWWIDHITEFIMPEQGDDPTVVLKEAAWDLGNASDRIAGFDERFLAPATTTKNDEGLNAVREKLLALRKWINDLRDRINKGYISVSDMLTEVWGIRASKFQLVRYLPPVLGVPFEEWYRQLYELRYRLWEVNYRRACLTKGGDYPPRWP
jgi:hypothetical protein